MSQGEKPAYQERSRKAREKIVRALDEALREKPFDQVTVAELAGRAGVAVGTVYRRFENKDALIPVISEIYQRRLEVWMAGEGAVAFGKNDDLRAALKKVMRKTWSILSSQAHLLRAVHLYARLKPELFEDGDWEKYTGAMRQSVESILTHYAGEVRRKNVKRATAMTAYLLNTIFLEKGLYADEPPATLFTYSGKALADEVADMLYAYLRLPEA